MSRGADGKQTMLMISVHLPKTAGVSFRTALQRHFGSALRLEYSDLPMSVPEAERNRAALRHCLANADADMGGLKCIHGHFLAAKYLPLSGAAGRTFVTWMRHPVDRLLSNYRYWRRDFDPSRASALRIRMMEEDWSFERFCLGPELRNMYSQFLFGFPLEYFSFVGITEFYNSDFRFFAQEFLGVAMEPDRLNVGDDAADRAEISSALRGEIERFHAADMDLYERALAMRLRRLSRQSSNPCAGGLAGAWPSDSPEQNQRN